MQHKKTVPNFQLVYSLGRHPYLGYIIEPHIVFLNKNGSLSLSYKRLFSNTITDYKNGIDEDDVEIIKLLDEIEQTNIIRNYYKKPVRPRDFFPNIFNEEFYEYVRPKIERHLLTVLDKIGNKQLYLMSKDGYPADRRVHIAPHSTSVLFHFRRSEHETRYFPTLKYDGSRIEFMFKDAEVIINEQAWLLLNNMLFHFDEPLEGKKLTPFLNKRYIAVPRSTEKRYYQTFVSGLIEKHNVYAQGFDIITEKTDATPIVNIHHIDQENSFISLGFRYGSHTFPADGDLKVSVKMEYNERDDQYTFHRIRRSLLWERKKADILTDLGLVKRNTPVGGEYQLPEKHHAQKTVFDWVNEHYEILLEKNFEIAQGDENSRYLIGKTSLELAVAEENDWFDIKAFAHFGAFKIPFEDLREHILHDIREFELPNGQVAIIPVEWFAKYQHVFHFSLKKNNLRLDKSHVGLLQDIQESTLTTLDRKLQKLTDFEGMQDIAMPQNFKGDLRPYQKAGYNWFHFLQQYKFGGCLADDMGLGKTVQTLALLQKEKEKAEQERIPTRTSLLILPTSLIYNWQNEAEKFTPQLKVYIHTGSNRKKSADEFGSYDLIITTYGIVRIDAEILGDFFFNYIILDESQHIKNATSKSFRAIKTLKSRHKLTLSGTPVENTVADLWSQLHFLNPGLLGTYRYFQDEFVQPIERKKDETKAARLQAIVKPFILRRTKSQVAAELPDKTEQIVYCSLTEEQETRYEYTKSEYRNALLDINAETDSKPSSIAVIQGLTKLRQLANHPQMLDAEYEFSSGKLETALEMLEPILAEGSKVLIFSQFVKHLRIFRSHFDNQGIRYAYLDGSTQDRAEAVESFKREQEIQVFLISIKAGGVGLNLTEAEYVFILDPWWNPAVEQQAIDRTHRIGQTKNVFVYKFISKDTVEEKILALQNRKKELAAALITTEESFVKSLSQEDLRELLS